MWNRRWLWLLLGFVLGTIFFALWCILRPARSAQRLGFRARQSKVEMVLDLISHDYVDSLPVRGMEDKTLTALVRQLDPHSEYIPKELFTKADITMRGDFEGIGVTFNMLTDTVVVLSVLPHGPAAKAGLVASDRIMMIGHDTIAGVKANQDSIVMRLRGPRGSKVSIMVERLGEKDWLPFTLTRDKIPVKSVEVYTMLDEKTGYLQLTRFSQTTIEEVQRAVAHLGAQGMSQLILDLRGNGGGVLQAACYVAQLFLPEGKLLLYTKGRSRERRDFLAQIDGPLRNFPLAVLIDEASASGSEIVAGAIQDNDRGFIVGRRSFGKGLVQEQFEFADSSALRLTVARYYTPSGRSIQRPYRLGNDSSYYDDYYKRFANGELLSSDSVHQDTTQRFRTLGGRVVYGGGGIMPDIFVPLDTSASTPYLSQLARRGLFVRYAMYYFDHHRQELMAFESPQAMETALDGAQVLSDFTAYAAQRGVPLNARQFETSKKVIRLQLYAQLAYRLWDSIGSFAIWREQDPALDSARYALQHKTVL